MTKKYLTKLYVSFHYVVSELVEFAAVSDLPHHVNSISY